MDEMVRVKLENGSEATHTRAFAQAKGLEILDKPATDARGFALDAKHQANLRPSGSKYSGIDIADLQADADARQLTVEGTGKDGRVLKSDLVSALDAHDGANGVTT